MTEIKVNGVDVEWPAKTISCGQICEIVEMPYNSVVRYNSDGRVVHPEQFIEVVQGHSFTVESIESRVHSLTEGRGLNAFVDDILLNVVVGGPEDFPGSDF